MVQFPAAVLDFIHEKPESDFMRKAATQDKTTNLQQQYSDSGYFGDMLAPVF